MARQRVVWTALGIVYVVWGSTYLAIRYVVQTVPPFLGAGVRFIVAGALMAGLVAVFRDRARLRVSRREAGASALVGGLLLLGGNGLVMVAERTIASGLAALGVAVVPLFVVLLRLATRDRPPAATLAGVGLGFAGLALLLDLGSGHLAVGLLIVLGAAASWSVGSFFSSRLPLPADPLVSTTYEMLFGGAMLIVLALARGEGSQFSLGAVSLASWLGLGYLVVFGSLVAFTAYVFLLQAAPISTVATYAYVNPAVAVLLGTMAGEPLTLSIALGGGLVVLAVAVVVTTESRARRRSAPMEPAPEPVPIAAERASATS